MNLLICEYVTAGGLGPAAGLPLLAEADAMVHALVRDFSAVPGVRVHTLRCPSLPALAETGVTVTAATWHPETYARALDACDAVLLVAPETDACLEQLTRSAEAAGVPVLGSSSHAVAVAADKRRCADTLRAAGIAQVGHLLADGAGPSDCRDGPAAPTDGWVLKPVDGCGCDGIRRFADLAAAWAAWTALPIQQQRGTLLQPWLPGLAASLCVLGSAHGATVLSVNRQHLAIAEDGAVSLRAVETGALRDDGTCTAVAAAIQAAIPGLRGLYGIDLVLGAAGPVVIEINPRVTAAYPGLAAVLADNPAQRWLAEPATGAARARPAPAVPAEAGASATAPAAAETPPALTGNKAPARRQATPRRAALLGWDLGGAHLKVAALDAQGRLLGVVQEPCALWRGLDQLTSLLNRLTSRWGTPDQHAVTMSGEMVDLFPERAAGVRALISAFQAHACGVPVAVYAGQQGFVSAGEVEGAEAAIASANWLASGHWAARHHPAGLLLDIGSTTTDLLTLHGGSAAPRSVGDAARLISRELVYTGLTRTPLMALAQRVPLQDATGRVHDCGVMAEWFATTADLYRVLGQLPESADQHPAADSGAKTWQGSARRLARMVGCDLHDHPAHTWVALARHFQTCQLAAIDQAIGALAPASTVVLCGVGRFVAAPLLAARGLAAVDFADLGGLLPEREIPAGQYPAAQGHDATRPQHRPGGPSDDPAALVSARWLARTRADALCEAASRAAPAVAVAALLAGNQSKMA